MYFLLLFMPAAIALKVMGAGDLWVFVCSGIAIIPLAGLMGRATENLAETMGPGIGGILNATMGNAAELIIGLFALWKGEVELVKASIIGSIIGNILLVLGLSILVGGLYHKRQTFNATAAGLGATLLSLAMIGLVIPAVFYYILQAAPPNPANIHKLEYLSEEIAAILAVLYLVSLIFSLRTHQHLFAGPEGEPAQAHPPEWSRRTSVIVLVVSTSCIGVLSEILVGSVNQAATSLGMSRIFIGVIVIAIIGNAAEHSTAVLVAAKNKMDLAVTICISSSIQVALFVAPVLMFAGLAMGLPMDLHFSPMEVVAVVIAIMVVTQVAQDGESHWMEGALLLAVYAILALAFYHLP